MVTGIWTYIRHHHLAFLALFIALGGTAWALQENSVKSKHIVNGQVKGVDVDESTLDLGAEPWHEVGSGAPEPDFTSANGCEWFNYHNGWNPASFIRDAAGIVHLRGRVWAAAENQSVDCQFTTFAEKVIFHLPAGFRPDLSETMPVMSNDKFGKLYVLNDGQVRLEGNEITADDASQWLQLDGISFRCGPSGEDGCP